MALMWSIQNAFKYLREAQKQGNFINSSCEMKTYIEELDLILAVYYRKFFFGIHF